MMSTRAGLALVAAAVMVGVVGCGGDAGGPSVETLTSQGQAAARANDWSGCIARYTSALAKSPESVTVLRGRADCEVNSGDNSGAIHDLDKAISLSSGDPGLLLDRGKAYANLGNATRASADFRQVVDLAAASPDDDVTAINGILNLKLLPNARDAASAALAHYPKHWRILLSMANVAAELGDQAGAGKNYDEALANARGPDRAQVLHERAQFRKDGGDLGGALSDENAAIAVDSTAWEYWERRAQIKQAKGDLSGAGSDLGQALNVDRVQFPNDNPVVIRLLEERGRLWMIVGRKTDAATDFQAALNLVPGSDNDTRATLERELASAKG